MASKLTEEQLDLVRTWAAQGVDLNGIQKRLAAECGAHLTYMEVRFLLLDHGIEIAEAAPAAKPSASPLPEQKKAPAPEPEVSTAVDPSSDPAAAKVTVTLDELQIPGTIFSGKVSFPSGASGAWFIDQTGRLGWSELSAKPTQYELQDFQTQLMQMLRGAM